MINRGGGRKGEAPKNRPAASRRPNARPAKAKRLRPLVTALRASAKLIRRLGWRRTLLGILLLSAFAGGFYLANLYNNISQLIAQRRAALTSAIYSAPLEITAGDEIGPLHLIDRLERLSYTRVPRPSHPGEFSMEPGNMTIYVREFRVGDRGYPATLFRLSFDSERVAGIAD